MGVPSASSPGLHPWHLSQARTPWPPDHDIQVTTLLESQATGLANAEYDLMAVLLDSNDARTTSLAEQDQNPTRSVEQVRRLCCRPQGPPLPKQQPPFPPSALLSAPSAA
jgi:hypothetical protein